jgi:2-polyprenyl-6-hydroxyphenyl methylase/3-demethylubiquinone-9 3-methyltransferase
MFNKLKKVFTAPGAHYLLTRFGGAALRKKCFDEKYLSGDWDFAGNPDSALAVVVEKYAAGGHILILGCGSASMVGGLSPNSFQTLLGIDISPEAVKRASRQKSEAVRFEVGDISKYKCGRKYDVILFSESIYYVNPLRRKRLLKYLADNLTGQGRIIVTIAQPERYAGILKMIRRNFQVAEDRNFQDSPRRLLVFR